METAPHQPPPPPPQPPTTRSQRSAPRRWASYVLRRHGLLFLQSPLTTVGFFLVLLGAIAGISLIPLVIGIPLLVVVIALARGYGGFQRQVFSSVLGRTIPAPPPVTDRTWWRPAAVWERVKDVTAWRAIGFHMAAFPVATIGFWLMAVGWFCLLAAVFWPVRDDGQDFELGPVEPWLIERVGDGAAFDAAVMLMLAIIAVALGAAATGVAVVFERLAGALLGPTQAQRMRRLEQQREVAVDAAAEQRRQTERDLHDGA